MLRIKSNKDGIYSYHKKQNSKSFESCQVSVNENQECIYYTLSHMTWLPSHGNRSKSRSQSSDFGLLRTADALPRVTSQLIWKPAHGPYSVIT